ncbi:MAG: efflux RND transporter permease subunit [Acidobacteriota bacterium]
MSLSKIAIHRPITTLVFLTSIMVIGAIAATRMKLAYFPDLEAPFIQIFVPYPNSSPSQIEKNIIKPIEETLATLSGIKTMNSTATADGASINLEFDWGKKLDYIRTEVDQKIELVRKDLPADVERINVFNFSTSDIPVVQARISAPGVDLAGNYDLLEKHVKVPIQRIPGVAKVELDGVLPKAVYVDLILDKLREHNVDVGRLVDRLQRNNINVSVGKVRNEDSVITVRALGSFSDLRAIEAMPINDQGLRLQDIAEVTYQEPAIEYGRHLNHSYAVAVQVFKEPTANTVEVATQVTHLIKNVFPNDPYLRGISMFVFEDQAAEIKNGLSGITDGGLWGGLFAIIILFVFLRRVDMTLVVSTAIPISILCGTAFLYYFGYTLNVMSMMGLMLSVGMLVDDAIVVLESIYKCRQEGLNRIESAERGTRTVGLAVTTSTLTTIIVFLPLIVGKKTNITIFLAEIGVSITITILCSLVVSLTLIPLVTSRYLKEHKVEDAGWIRWLKRYYQAALRWTFRHRWATAGLGCLLVVSAILPNMLGLQTGVFAGTNNKRQQLIYDFSDFTYKSDVEKVVSKAESFLDTQNTKELPFESVYSYFTDSEAFTIVTFARDDVSDDEAKAFRKRIRDTMPKFGGVKTYFEDESQESGGGSTFFSLYLYGEDLEHLKKVAREAEVPVARVKGVEDVRVDANTGRKEVQMVLNREKAMKAGITPQELAQIMMFCLGGQRLHRYVTPEKEIDMILGLRVEDRENIEDLKNLQIGTPSGPIQLRSIVDFNTVAGQNQIQRQNRKNFLSVRAVYEGKDWDKAREEIAGVMNAVNLPPGYSWSFDRRVQRSDEDNKIMMVNFALALALVYIVMAALFESLVHPVAIIISIPFALIGVLWLLLLTGAPFNLMAQIGLLILMGVVVRNGIVLVERVHQLREAGLTREQALLQAGDDRLRPIIMTAATTILGLVPLALGRSALLGLSYYPLARAVIGGLTASTVLTLIVLPFVYTLFDDAAAWARRVWLLSRPAQPAAVAAELPIDRP